MMEEKCFKVEQLFLTNYQFTRLQNEARHEVQLQELLSELILSQLSWSCLNFLVIDHKHWNDRSSKWLFLFAGNILLNKNSHLMKCSPMKNLPENIPRALKWPFIEFWKLAPFTNGKKSPPNTIEQSYWCLELKGYIPTITKLNLT